MNPSMLTPCQSLPWKNSILHLPKNPSRLWLSGERPFLDIDRMIPRSSHIPIHPGQR